MTADSLIHTLVQVRPRFTTRYVARGRTALVMSQAGVIDSSDGRYGLFVRETRLLSRYRYLIDGKEPVAAALSMTEPHAWVGVYAAAPPHPKMEEPDGMPLNETVELHIARFVGEGMHEEIRLTNYSQQKVSLLLQLECDADFADQRDATPHGRRVGRVTHQWDEKGELRFHYHAEHEYRHQDNSGRATVDRDTLLRVTHSGSEPQYSAGALSFSVTLEPKEEWHACLDTIAVIDGKTLQPGYPCGALEGKKSELDKKTDRFLERSTAFEAPGASSLAPIVIGALEQAKRDIASMRMADLDQADDAWVTAAGYPTYVALFGRDPLITGWQSMMVTPDILRGTLAVLQDTQGREENDWRDEQPGRFIHQMLDAPLSHLQFDPLARYYGTISAPAFYPEALFTLWALTNDTDRVKRFLPAALKGLAWLEKQRSDERDCFYAYKTRSKQGVKNQCWKDSEHSIVYADGSEVKDPIATSETQGIVYTAKRHLALLLYELGEKDDAKRLLKEADELKKRFNDRFWMDDEKYYALGLDPKGKLIRSVSSDAGACLASGIIDDERARLVADRLMAPDMFTGWGVRTLSADHAAYNPFSYQRGTVWPVENAIMVLGFVRTGLHHCAERLVRSQFEAAAHFPGYRLPEVFSGHPRSPRYPFPMPYLSACWPQAWSASALFMNVQSLLGLMPFAPLDTLVVDPNLPEWLPEITIKDLKIGEAAVTIRFFRKEDGKSDYSVVDKRGKLHVIRQPSPWSLTAGYGERIRDLIQSVAK